MKKVIAIAALISATFAAKAQSSTATQTINLNLVNAIELTFTANSSTTGTAVNLAFNNVNDYATGVVSDAQQLKVRSNRNFSVTVKSSATAFTYSGTTSPAPVMNVADVLGLMVTANGTGGSIGSGFSASTYNALTSSASTLISGGTRGGNQTFSVKYQAQPGFAYPAGTYTTDVVYTATQQ